MKQEFKNIAADLIDPPKDAVRMDAASENLRELADSIKEMGLLQPITVFPVNGRFETLIGDRRQRACKIAELKEIPCIVVENPDTLTQVIRLTENIQRMDMSPIEEGAICKDLQKLNNWGYKLLAAHLGKSKQWVIDRLKLIDMPPDLQILVHNKQLGLSHALELNRIEDENTRKRYAEEVMRCGTSVKTLEGWVTMYLHAMQTPDIDMSHVEDPANLPQHVPHKIRCQLCEEYYVVRDVTSVIVCRGCIQVLREAKHHESGMAAGTDPGGANSAPGVDDKDRTPPVED